MKSVKDYFHYDLEPGVSWLLSSKKKNKICVVISLTSSKLFPMNNTLDKQDETSELAMVNSQEFYCDESVKEYNNYLDEMNAKWQDWELKQI